jgi:uncharacterized protein (TIRG00374 family)
VLVGILKLKEILKGGGINISFFDLFSPSLAGFSIMYLFPIMMFGGETFRGYILKSKNSVPLSKGMASIITDRILDWTTNIIVIFFGTTLFLFKIGLPPKKLAIVFGGAFLFWLLGISFFYFKIIKRESMAKFFVRLFNFRYFNNQPFEIEKEFFNFFKIKNRSLWKSVGLAFLEEVVVFSRAWLLISFLGKSVSFFSTLSVVGFAYLAGMIPITAALGSNEVVQIFAFSALGLGAATGTAFTMISRGAELIIALIGLVILFQLGFSFFKNKLTE